MTRRAAATRAALRPHVLTPTLSGWRPFGCSVQIAPGHGRMASCIAQLGDSHITTGTLGAGPAAGLPVAVAWVDQRPDCVVITGGSHR